MTTDTPRQKFPTFYVQGMAFASQHNACRIAERKALAAGTYVVIYRQDYPHQHPYECGRVIPKNPTLTEATS